MIDQNLLEILIFVSVVGGAFGRTMLPYIQMLKEAEEGDKPAFQHKYFFTMLYSLALSLGVTLTLFPSVVQNIPTNASISSIMVIGGLAGWGANSIVNGITSNVHPEDVRAKVQRLKKTEGKEAVTDKAGVQLGDKTIP